MNDLLSSMLDVVKSENFLAIQDNLAVVTELAIITVDYKGVPLTHHSNCSNFCSQIRKMPTLSSLCEKCDSHGGIEAARLLKPYIYTCHAGIVDLAVPIIINGMYLGAIMAGQVRLDVNDHHQPIESIFKFSDLSIVFEQNEELKISFEELPIMRYEKIKAIAQTLSHISNYTIEFPVTQMLKDAIDDTEIQTMPILNTQIIQKKSLLAPAIQYINGFPNEKISLSKMAQLCNISSSYFSRLFTREYQQSFSSYVNNIKIKKSIDLLETPDLSINYIADKLGYDDTSYFIRLFKKTTGFTPAEYRKNKI